MNTRRFVTSGKPIPLRIFPVVCGLCLSWGTAHGEAFLDLFDGKTLTGWVQRNGTATYRVEEGTIVGRTSEGSPNSFLCTQKEYADFELLFEVKVDDRLNSGVQIRSKSQPDLEDGRVNGPQVEIEASGPQGAEAGYVYGESAGGWMTAEADLKPHKHFKDGEWNRYRILAVGPNIKVWINDTLISDLTHQERFDSHPRGFIGLQVHGIAAGEGPYEVAWRNLELREIVSAPATEAAAKFAADKLIGEWKYAGGESNGAPIDLARLSAHGIQFTKETITLTGDNMKFVFRYELDAASRPVGIKLTMTESPFGAGAVARGIVNLTDDKLELCYAAEGDPPQQFAAKANSNHRYVVMKRKPAN